jgi:hypothetical protein
LYIQKQLKELGIANSIGVTTGKAFCGAVGSEERREYAMVGDIVVCIMLSFLLWFAFGYFFD